MQICSAIMRAASICGRAVSQISSYHKLHYSERQFALYSHAAVIHTLCMHARSRWTRGQLPDHYGQSLLAEVNNL